MKHVLLYVFLICIFQINAQSIPDDVKPPSWNLSNLSNLKAKKLPSFDLKSLQEEDAINDNDKSKPWRFGYDIYVDDNLFEKGKLTELPNGDKIWRIAYKSEGAFSINFLFDQFLIPEGSKLYVYNNSKDDLIRPFTHHNNNPEEVLGTWMVKGNTAIIEYHQPAHVSGPAKLVIGSVVHGYRTGHMFQKALNDSGPCNQDVDCDITPAGADPFSINQKKEDVKSANALMISGGFSFCSGTLINNTNNDQTPYFLTANHCGGGEPTWAFRFNWRSDNPSCGTFANSGNGSFNQTVSGATFRASSSRSDMKLVEINDTSFFTTNASNLVWAGWNRSTAQLPNLSFGIHHPSGDIQKVCRDDQGGLRTTINFNGDPNTQVWRIADWDLGVTEPGSSGSALYNQDGHIIGLLSGGFAACSGTNDNNQEDWYGRFGVAWDFGASSSQRLDFWLDPAGSNPITLDQFPPLQVFNNDARVTTVSSSNFFCNEGFTPDVVIVNQGALNLTSATVEYQLDAEPATVINWTGDLSTGQQEIVDSASYQNLGPGPHTFTITVSNPNGVPDQNTTNDTSVFNFTVAENFATNDVIFNITTDDYAAETSWELRNSSGALISTGPSSTYADNTTNQEVINIPSFDECYTFTILDSFGDGICCGYGNGSYNLEDDSGNLIISGGEFGASESITFKALNPLSIDESIFQNQFRFYPNPVGNMLNIESNRIIDRFNYEIINTLGQTVVKGVFFSSTTNSISMKTLESGIYFIKISSEGRIFTQKLIKE